MSSSRFRPVLGVSVAFGLFVVFLYAGCMGSGTLTGGGMLAEGGWVSEGDDVIVVEAAEAATQDAALDRVLRRFERSGIGVDILDREVGYLLSTPKAVNDTLSVRLITLVTDSATIEIAGQFAGLEARAGEWARVSWSQDVPRGEGAWAFMKDVASDVGAIQEYEEDPEGYDAFECGGRRCDEEQECWSNVCRNESPR